MAKEGSRSIQQIKHFRQQSLDEYVQIFDSCLVDACSSARWLNGYDLDGVAEQLRRRPETIQGLRPHRGNRTACLWRSGSAAGRSTISQLRCCGAAGTVIRLIEVMRLLLSSAADTLGPLQAGPALEWFLGFRSSDAFDVAHVPRLRHANHWRHPSYAAGPPRSRRPRPKLPGRLRLA